MATAVSELARNALQYAGGGRASFSIQAVPALLVITIQDQGGGIADLTSVLEGRYVSRTGMGLGINGSRRLVDQFQIASTPQSGTAITLGKRLPQSLMVTPQLIEALAADLARQAPDDPLTEIQQQNQELLSTLEELRARQREVEELNAALVDANDRLTAHQAELQRADRAKTEFLAVLAHELRNPLGALTNALYLAGQPATAGKSGEGHLGVARRQTVQLARLVEDLLDASRITQGKIELRLEQVELAPILAEAVESSRALLESRGQQLESCIPAERINLRADAARLTQVFTNLLTNASKFTPPAGRIRVEAHIREEDPEEVVVSVWDSGVGIAAHLQDRIFEMFAQAPQTLERSHGGLGIGLTLVRVLVEMHGGSVSVASAGRDQGATFTVSLPVVRNSVPVRDARPVPAGASRQPLRILVVDDHADAAETLAEILESWDHSVCIARDGPQAIVSALDFLPDWVLCDIGLPGLDGYGVAAALRLQPETAQARLVAVTGYGTPDEVLTATEAGFDAHLTKPLDPQALERLLGGN